MLARPALVTIAILSGGACSGSPGAGSSSPPEILSSTRISFEFVADAVIPTGARFPTDGGLELGGLSSIAHREGDEFVAISDAQSDPRIYTLRVQFVNGELLVTPTGVVRLRPEAVPTLADTPPDFEGLAIRGADGRIFASTEGDGSREPRAPAAVLEFAPSGDAIGSLPIPEKFLPTPVGPLVHGVQSNAAFEALALTPNGAQLVTATEAPLVQDAPPPQLGAVRVGGLNRILTYDASPAGFRPGREYAYPIDGATPPRGFGDVRGDNGLVDLLPLSSDEFLALERSFVTETRGAGARSANNIRLFRFALSSGEDVASHASLRGASIRAVQKTLVFDLSSAIERLRPELRSLENFEGMCFGPTLPDGSRSVLLISDNNFRTGQRTAFVLLRLRTS